MNKQSIDGFIPNVKKIETPTPKDSDNIKDKNTLSNEIKKTTEIKKTAIEDFDLNITDNDFAENRQTKKPKRRLRRIILVVICIILLVGGYFGYRLLNSTSKIFNGGIVGLFQNVELKKDSMNRTNILVFGTEEDSERGAESGGYLTDSIMVLSYNHDNKTIGMFSIPRDLWVKYSSPCSVGYQGKINATYLCSSNDTKDEVAGANALKNKVSEVSGIDIQYYAHVNFAAVKKLIDAVGGVEITIESSDPRGIYDPAFDWVRKDYIKFKNGPTGILDGNRALALMRSRNSGGGYGLPNSNFDRENHQRKIIMALINKIQSKEVIGNLGTMTNILGILSDNVKSNIETSELKSVMSLAKSVNISSMKSISLIGEGVNVVKTGNINGQSVVVPIGIDYFDYSPIKKYLNKSLSDQKYLDEKAKIGFYNATTQSGLAGSLSDKFEDLGFISSEIGNAKDASNNKYKIYNITNSKPETLKKIKHELGTDTEVIEQKPSFNYDMSIDIAIVITK